MEVLTVLIIAAIIGIALFLNFPQLFGFGSNFNKYWSKGIVPPNLDNSSESLTLIHISLAGILVGKHPVEVHKKLVFLYKYLLNDQHLRQSEDQYNNYYKEVRTSLVQARKYPIQLNSVAAYLNKYNFQESFKLKLIQFLADFAFVDQQIHPLELQLIQSLAEKINLSKTQIDKIISPMQETQERRARAEQESWKNRQATSYVSPNNKAKYCEILGVALDADLKQIKKAYRSLAMENHPDKFVNAEENVYQKAQQKFIEIQLAYEYLEKLF